MYEVRFANSAAQVMYDVRGTMYDLKIPAPPARKLDYRQSSIVNRQWVVLLPIFWGRIFVYPSIEGNTPLRISRLTVKDDIYHEIGKEAQGGKDDGGQT